ncbi:hypothetical protein [Paraburkholderia sediminicola]|uniref:hypothetical protein n=1 Tax=Paraburkholderia sediminicola TaxID=458836 RepID=UPI0038B7D413
MKKTLPAGPPQLEYLVTSLSKKVVQIDGHLINNNATDKTLASAYLKPPSRGPRQGNVNQRATDPMKLVFLPNVLPGESGSSIPAFGTMVYAPSGLAEEPAQAIDSHAEVVEQAKLSSAGEQDLSAGPYSDRFYTFSYKYATIMVNATLNPRRDAPLIQTTVKIMRDTLDTIQNKEPRSDGQKMGVTVVCLMIELLVSGIQKGSDAGDQNVVERGERALVKMWGEAKRWPEGLRAKIVPPLDNALALLKIDPQKFGSA